MTVFRHLARLLAGAAWIVPVSAAPVLPTGGQVTHGQATIGQLPDGLRIDQASGRAVIDWAGFSVGEGGRVHFANGTGATLNRVLGGDPSSIAGRLTATGSLWLVNPAGVIVSPTGQVITGGHFVASTRPLDSAMFMDGQALLAEGAGAGGVTNQGRIETGGDTVLIGAFVDNPGLIEARGGTALVAADRVMLREATADARIHIEAVSGRTGDVSTAGRIAAAAVELQAAGGNVYALAADTSGVARATAGAIIGNRILLVAGGDVRVAGRVDASGDVGGRVDITAGSRVILTDSAQVSAAGNSGDGGSIRIGGARQGGLPGEARPLASAQAVFVETGATIDAGSATRFGGEIILWSEQRTRFDGLVRADGPAGGGFVETSSRGALQITAGQVLAGNGQWLLDPRNVIIQAGGPDVVPPQPDVTINPPPGAGAYTIAGQFVTNALNNGTNVTITTTQPASTDAGNITVNWTFNLAGAGSLTLRADNDIIVNNAFTLASTGNLALVAGRDISVNPTQAFAIELTNVGNATLTAGRTIGIGKVLRQGTNSRGSFSLVAAGDIAITAGLTKGLLSSGDLVADAGGNITTGNTFSNSASGSVRLVADGNVVLGGDLTATAVSSGGYAVEAGGRITVNGQMQHNGSGNITLVANGDGIRHAGQGNRNYYTTGGVLTLRAPAPNGDIVFGRDGNVAGNMRWNGGRGGMVVEAGRDVRLQPGAANGRWSRVGSLDATGALTITAGRDIDVFGGTVPDNFAEIVGLGFVTLTAGRSVELDSAVSPARIQARGSGLTISTPSGIYDGFVESLGETLLTGNGTHAFAVSPSFTLNRGYFFTLDDGSRITATVPLAITTTGPGDIRLRGAVSGTRLLAIAGDELQVRSTVTMSDPGDALVLVAGRKFVNSPGNNTLFAPNGRWLVYSVSPFDDERADGLTPDAPNLYGRTYAGNPPASILPAGDSRRIYSFVPTLTLTADSGSKIYGQGNPGLAFTTAGLVPGDLLADALATGPTVASTGFPSTAPVGSYAVTVAATASDQGYRLQLADGTLVVNRAPLGVVADARSKIYGDADPALTFTATGFVNGETAAVVAGALARAPGENVGPYAITQGTLDARNYAISFTGATFTIDPATLTVRALAITRLYGDPDPVPLPFEASGFRRGDDEGDLTGALARVGGENVGTYAIGRGTLGNPNYVIAFTAADLRIVPAPLIVDADDAAKTYGAPDPVLTFAASGFRLGDTAASLSGALARDPGENVGVYDIVQGTLANANYAIQFTGGNFEIDPAPLLVMANPQSREYGLADPVLGFTATGFQFGETASVLTGALTRTPGENVGLYAILEGNLGATNYDIQFTGADLQITPAPLQIIPANVSVKVADLPPDPPLAFSTIGFRRGDTAATALTGALTRQDAGGTTPGTYQILPGTLAAVAGNYTLSFAAATFSILEQILRIVALDRFKTYGAADPVLTFTATGFLPGDDESILTGSLTRALGEDVGLYAILQGTLGAPGYTINFTPGFFVINPAILTIVAEDAIREYGLADSIPFSFAASGFQFADDESVLSGRLGRDPGENVGTYGITIGNLTAKNYLFDFTPATLRITPAPLTVVAADAARLYGGTDPSPLAFAASGFRLGDSADILTGALARTPGENVGLYPILQNTLSAGANYAIAFTPGQFRISPAPLAVIAEDKTREYGLADPALSVAANGFVRGDTAATALSGALVRAAGEHVGVYGIAQGSLAAVAGNYDISFTPGEFAITPAPLSVAALPVTRLYGDPDPAPLPFTASGFRLSDSAATVLSGALGRAAGENVGNYAIGQGSLTANGNYTLGFVGSNLTIQPAPLLVVANDITKIYGAADPALTFAASGFRLGDTTGGVLTGGLARASGESVAGSPYAITQGSLAANANYSIGFTGARFAITPAGLVVVADLQARLYGRPDPALTFAASGFVAGDTAATVLSGALARVAGENVADGPFAITQGSLAANSNYTIAFTGSALSITPQQLTLTADDQAILYGDPFPPFTVQAGAGQLQFADTLADILSGSAATAGEIAVGQYPITAGTLALTTANYRFDPTTDFTDGTLTIARQLLTVVADAQGKTYGAADPALTFTATGFEYADDPSVLLGALARAAGEDVGTYAIGQGTLAADNYLIRFTGADFRITPAGLVVVADPQSKTYGATDPVLTFAATGFQFGEDAGVLSGALTRVAGENVGLYDIGVGTLANPNYMIRFTGAKLTIDPALLRVVADPQTREYGLTDPVLTFVASGFQFGEDTSVLVGGLARAPGENVGRYAIGQGNLAGANYAIAFMPADLAVTPAPLAIDPADSGKVYGDPDPLPFPFTATGLRRGDTAATALTGALTRQSGELPGDYAILPGTLAAVNGNYVLSVEAAIFEIVARLLRVEAIVDSKIYGDPDPLLGFFAEGFAPGEDDSIFTGELVRAPGEDAGDYVISRGTLAAPGYVFAFIPGLLTIERAPLEVNALDATREYGLPDPGAFAFTATGFRRGDDASALTGALARVAGENVGTYEIGIGTLDSRNYDIFSFGSGQYTITPAPLTVVAADAGKVYGSADPAPLPFAAAGFRLGDTAAILSGGLTRAAGEDVGNYAIGLGSLSAGANYAIAFTPARFGISPAALRIVADNLSREFGLADPALTFAATGLVAGDTVATALTGGLARAAGEDVGLYAIGQGSLAARNYSIAFAGGSLTITPAPLRVMALDAARLVFTPNPPLALVANGLRRGDSLASIGISGTTDAVIESPPGAYPIRVIGSPRNYALTRVPGTLTVQPIPVPFTPEQIEVPALGGLVQQGVAMGLNSFVDTISPTRRIATGGVQPLLSTSRFSVSIETGAPPAPAGLGGASPFDPAGAIQ